MGKALSSLFATMSLLVGGWAGCGEAAEPGSDGGEVDLRDRPDLEVGDVPSDLTDTIPEVDEAEGADSDPEPEVCEPPSPWAVCPPNYTDRTGSTQTLEGGWERAPGCEVAHALWRLVSAPPGSTGARDTELGPDTITFSADVPGDFILEFTVTDSTGEWSDSCQTVMTAVDE